MASNDIRLGVNIDHIATVRQARGTTYPDPVDAALIASRSGADFITLHLREDRRHIQDHDVIRLKEVLPDKINFEMAITDEMLAIASDIQPRDCCLVPEKREELTTEGGLDVLGQMSLVRQACDVLGQQGIKVSLFVDADIEQIDAACEVGAPIIEIHTGHYAESEGDEKQFCLDKIRNAVEYGNAKGLQVNVGHGLHYQNVKAIAQISGIRDFNIGHAIVAEALMSGMEQAVSKMKKIISNAS